MPGEGESFASALDRDKVRSHDAPVDVERPRCGEAKGIGAGGGHDPVGRRLDPRANRGVIGAQRKLHSHRDPSLHSVDNPHQARRALTSPRHEVDDAYYAFVGLELSLENESPGSVPARARAHVAGWSEQPAAVTLVPQQRGETGRGIEPWKAQPVHGSVAANERRSLEIPDQAIVLDPHVRCLLLDRRRAPYWRR